MEPTLEQQRAQNAWEVSEKYTDAQINFVKGLPMLIMNSGLMQVLAFAHEKSKDHESVALDLRKWLHHRFPKESKGVDFDSFMRMLMQATPLTYQAINTEAFAWLKWLRQMAAARKKGD